MKASARPACFLLLLFAAFFGAVAPAARAQEYITPPVGSTSRKEVLDAIRPRVERHFGQTVKFVPTIFRVSPRWALVVATAQRPNGAPIDYTLSPGYRKNPREIREDVRQGMLFGGVIALLRQTGSGAWEIADVVYDAGDAVWSDYDVRFGVPKAMLRPPE